MRRGCIDRRSPRQGSWTDVSPVSFPQKPAGGARQRHGSSTLRRSSSSKFYMDPGATDAAGENVGFAGGLLTVPLQQRASCVCCLPDSMLRPPYSSPLAQQAAHWPVCGDNRGCLALMPAVSWVRVLVALRTYPVALNPRKPLACTAGADWERGRSKAVALLGAAFQRRGPDGAASAGNADGSIARPALVPVPLSGAQLPEPEGPWRATMSMHRRGAWCVTIRSCAHAGRRSIGREIGQPGHWSLTEIGVPGLHAVPQCQAQ